MVLVAVGALILAAVELRSNPEASAPQAISGSFALLLDASTNLGASRAETVELTAELRGTGRPDRLVHWSAGSGLSVRWRNGDNWAVLQGAPANIATAFHVAVQDYRGRQGQLFYASPQQPLVPESLRDSVAGLGRILSYSPYHSKSPSIMPLDVPDHSLPPESLSATYNVSPLSAAGYTGKNTTIVVFAFDGFDQPDLDTYTDMFKLPRFTPEVIGPGMQTRT